MLVSKLLKKLEDFENRKHDLGPSYHFWSSHLEIYTDGSGALIVTINRKDGTNPVEKLCKAVGLDAVTKKFPFGSVKDLMALLENKDLLKSDVIKKEE